MEKVWYHTFYNEHEAIRGKMTQIIFETFNVCTFYVSIHAS